MFGKNKISPIITKKSQKTFKIVKIFKTLQGEGRFAGYPAIFIRLGGCNLQCDFCDTEFDNYDNFLLEEIIENIEDLAIKDQNNKIKLIVLTGGEPLRQNIENLVKALLKLGFLVQIETNGTIKREISKKAYIICSPKMIKGKYKITKELIDYVDAFKFIIRKNGDDYKEVPNIKTTKPIYVQAMDEYDEQKNKENLAYTIQLAIENNYILSLQQHKILGVE